MRSMVRWAVRNAPAMNTLMVTLLLVGVGALVMLRREVFPAFQLELIFVSVPYPGASPDEVEDGIILKIEEAIRSIEGLKKITSIAREGNGTVTAEVEVGADVAKVLDEVRSAVDRIPSFPALAEDPEVKQAQFTEDVAEVAVLGKPEDTFRNRWELREVAERVRNELLLLPSVDQVELNAPEFQIDVEIPEETLRKYNLTHRKVADLIRQQNVELPAGVIRSQSTEYLLRGKNKRITGAEIAKLPVVTRPDGTVLTVGDLGTVNDGFVETGKLTRIEGRPAISIAVKKTESKDLLAIADQVEEYATTKKMPAGYEMTMWGDRSGMVRDRLSLLARNGIAGLVLVFIVLSLFLELRLAFWVAAGIPISILGTCAIMYQGGQTLNMLSMFAFIMGLGIVVDDAIVIGENIFRHREMGKDFVKAAVDGTVEVAPSVMASVMTTIIAFLPLMFVSGIMGKFIAVMPFAVIAMFAISLVESIFILPVHLKHGKRPGDPTLRQTMDAKAADRGRNLLVRSLWYLTSFLLGPFLMVFEVLERASVPLRNFMDRLLRGFIDRIYLPVLRRALRNAPIVYAVAVTLLLFSAGLVAGGYAPWTAFPKIDSEFLIASVAFESGTPQASTRAAVERMEAGARKADERIRQDSGEKMLVLVNRSVGGAMRSQGGFGQFSVGDHLGMVMVELTKTDTREVSSDEFIAQWRAATGEIPGTDELTFKAAEMGPGGTPIEFKLLGNDMAELEAAVETAKERLETYPGVFDVGDDSHAGKWELQIAIRPEAKALGLNLADVADTVRSAYYGQEVQRLQRGRHEIKLMVRSPEEQRQSLERFDEIRIRTADGREIPLPEVAEVTIDRGYNEINRIDQKRSITVSADIDPNLANGSEVVADLKADFEPQLTEAYPGVNFRWEGQAEQTAESMGSMFLGFGIALLAMFALLTVEFRSYMQPLIILSAIPFGIVGAIGGHFLLGEDLTLFSVFGIVALSGVVANDSIVLVDFINRRRRQEGFPLKQALLDAGSQRLRPVLLTSLTTVCGLLPMLFETSLQAQVLIPMAISLAGGLVTTTVLVTILVPVMYQTWAAVVGATDGIDEDADFTDDLPPAGKQMDLHPPTRTRSPEMVGA